MKKLIAFLYLINMILPIRVTAQKLLIDSTFSMYSLFYDPLNSINGGSVDSLGRVVLFGSLNNSSFPYREQILRILDDGTLDLTYSHYPYFFPSTNIFRVTRLKNGSLIYQSEIYNLYKSSVNGQIYDTAWSNNYLQCNYNSSTIWLPDSSVYNHFYLGIFGLEYPIQSGDIHYFIKLDNNGNIDTAFNHDTDDIVRRIIQYGSDKCLLVGQFNSYDNIPNKFICRIDSSGEIDTSFNSVFVGGLGIEEVLVQSDGRILVSGNLLIQNVADTLQLVRLLPNGEIDSSFNNSITIYDGFDYYDGGCMEICQTRDSAFIIAGSFTEVDGIPKGRIVKIDKNGHLQPNEFLGSWVDSCDAWVLGITPAIVSIIPDRFSSIERYYVAGRFNRVNGQFGDCIFRIKVDSTVSLIENTIEEDLHVFPNPFRDKFTIHLGNDFGMEMFQIKLFDQYGHILLDEQKSLPAEFYLTHLSGGLYFVQINSNKILAKAKIFKY